MKTLTALAAALTFSASMASAAPVNTTNDPFVSTQGVSLTPFFIVGALSTVIVLGATDSTN